MSAPSIATVKERLEAILATVSGVTTVITSADCKLDPSTLPAVEVRVGSAERERNNRDQRYTAREYELWLFVDAVDRPDDPAATLAALEAAYTLVDGIPDAFLNLSRLELSNAPLDGVRSVSEISDSGAALSPFYDGNMYSVVRYRLTVTTQR